MPKVKNKDTGEEIEVSVGEELSEVVKDNGWPIAFGCEDGVCGTCIVEVSEGQDNISPAGEIEEQTLEMMGMKDGDHRLSCQCKVNGDICIKGM